MTEGGSRLQEIIKFYEKFFVQRAETTRVRRVVRVTGVAKIVVGGGRHDTDEGWKKMDSLGAQPLYIGNASMQY